MKLFEKFLLNICKFGPLDIERLTEEANAKLEVPIYGLAFGRGADFGLIKSISATSGAFARKIFEGSGTVFTNNHSYSSFYIFL